MGNGKLFSYEQIFLKLSLIRSVHWRHRKECENESIQHKQKNASFAHPDRNLLPLLRCYMYRMQTREKNWKGAIQGWRSVKFSYFYCVCCFVTRIYGGLWVTPSIIDKYWKDWRWNCAVLEKQTFKHITWILFAHSYFCFSFLHYNDNNL